MPLFVFRCPEGHSTEFLRSRDVETVWCACGAAARRAAVNRIGVTGFAATPRDQKNYRQEFKEYQEASQEVDYVYSRHEYNGDPVKSPDLFGEGIRRAKELGL